MARGCAQGATSVQVGLVRLAVAPLPGAQMLVRGEGKYRAAVRDTWPRLKARRVFRCACPRRGGAHPGDLNSASWQGGRREIGAPPCSTPSRPLWGGVPSALPQPVTLWPFATRRGVHRDPQRRPDTPDTLPPTLFLSFTPRVTEGAH